MKSGSNLLPATAMEHAGQEKNRRTYVYRVTGVDDKCDAEFLHCIYGLLHSVQEYKKQGIVGDVVGFVQVMQNVEGSKSMRRLSDKRVLQHEVKRATNPEVVCL